MLKLKAAPTFTADIKIPTPDGMVTIKGTFKHMAKSAFTEFVKIEREKEARPDEEVVMDIMIGWDGVDAEFNAENIREFCQQYHAAGKTIVETFVDSLTQFRKGN